MRILVFSLFLCLNFFTSHAQEKKEGNSSFIMVNGSGCTDCTIERTKASIQNIIISIDAKYERIINFTIKISGQSSIKVKGSKSNNIYQRAIKHAKIGDKIQVFDIRTEKGILNSYILIKITK